MAGYDTMVNDRNTAATMLTRARAFKRRGRWEMRIAYTVVPGASISVISDRDGGGRVRYTCECACQPTSEARDTERIGGSEAET